MPTDPNLRLYALFKATEELRTLYAQESNSADLATFTQKLLLEAPYDSFPTDELEDLVKPENFKVVATPSKDWKAAFVGDAEHPDLDVNKLPAELMIVYTFTTSLLLERFLKVVHHGQQEVDDPPISAAGVDIGVGSADHWCPAANGVETFGTRADARRTVAANELPGSLRGQRVNVVIIDEGLHQPSIPAQNWGGGFDNVTLPVPAGSAKRTSHGMMIARTILDLAPDAVLYDLPLIPERITQEFFSGLSPAHVIYEKLLVEIEQRRLIPQWEGPWILVNAWAIFDRSVEPSLGNYTENMNTSGHPLINLVRKAVQQLRIDVIFAAGNCGEFCASRRCGGVDRGPGRSIWGANALPGVITAGAVLANEMWAGYSSQGPGPAKNGLARFKPDLCAPSNFREINDAAVTNSGTSTACAMTAGIVAALRSKAFWHQKYVHPSVMHRALTRSARKTQGPGWNGRLGHGILDAGAAMAELP